MTENEFRQLASTYGGDLARWPAPLRGEAAVLVRHAPHLGAVLRAELAFDERIRPEAPAVTSARADAVMAAVAGAIVRLEVPVLPSQDGGWRHVRLAFAVCALLGFVLGLAMPARLFQVSAPPDAIALLAGDDELGLLSR